MYKTSGNGIPVVNYQSGSDEWDCNRGSEFYMVLGFVELGNFFDHQADKPVVFTIDVALNLISVSSQSEEK